VAGEAQQPRRRAAACVAFGLVLLGAVFWLPPSETRANGRWRSTQHAWSFSAGASFPPACASRAQRVRRRLRPGRAGRTKAVDGRVRGRVNLDRALFETLLPGPGDFREARRGVAEGRRWAAERDRHLPGLSPAQLDQLAQLRGDLAYTAALAESSLAAGYVESRAPAGCCSRNSKRRPRAAMVARRPSERMWPTVSATGPWAAHQRRPQQAVQTTPPPKAAADAGVPTRLPPANRR